MTDAAATTADIPSNLADPLADLLLALADDKLMMGHRDSEWTGLGPILEEDIAFSSLAQDQIGHAQSLYQLIGELAGKTEDQLAFGRQPAAYRCASIVEVPDEFDWATALARRFFCDHFHALQLKRLSESSWKPLAALSRRLAAEQDVRLEHVDTWLVRLGTGTEESHSRMQAGLNGLAPIAPGLFEETEGLAAVADAGLYPMLSDGTMFDQWKTRLEVVTQRARLTLIVNSPDPSHVGGRRGSHTGQFIELLDEMCEVYRQEPDAAW